MNDNDLELLFAQAKADALQPSNRLLADVLQSALDHQTTMAPVTRISKSKGGFWQTFAAALGGGAALAGLSTATLAGLWLGFVQPDPVSALTQVFWSDLGPEQVELIPSYDDILVEG